MTEIIYDDQNRWHLIFIPSTNHCISIAIFSSLNECMLSEHPYKVVNLWVSSSKLMYVDIKILSFIQRTQIDTKSDPVAGVLCLSPYFMLLRESEKIQLAFRDQLKYHIFLLLLYLLA